MYSPSYFKLLDQFIDGGMILNPHKNSLGVMCKKFMISKKDNVVMGGSQITINRNLKDLDTFADSAGVSP